ncbi:hypothetical protein H7I87_18710 [Mycobacterium timonense]|uniref:Uncharacterized protein n=1 Tax=Mycobacterium bouchedurhonense TaxID=701041 RepID=A0AAW5S9C5_MYCBC|nr:MULTISPECIES: hypothetical protein [Mycobacterium avium complex (MAC)]MCV6991787.1 hypothetical protein [Mycobacterium bouchedurhonense]MCV6996711.1 hypothetical protein [Mycobacterium timonense]ORA40587.1 hypothetical protein BST19_27705 [Mycobacterium bouchedurhonense]
MTVEFYDLAQRIYAQRSGHPVLRVAGALFVLDPQAIMLTATQTRGVVTASVAVADQPATQVSGMGVLRALAAAGARFDAPMRQLVVAGASDLTALVGLARAHSGSDDPASREAAAVVGWWADRAGYPGTSAVVDLCAHSRQRYITAAVPAAERSAEHWRSVFAVGEGTAGLWRWAQHLANGTPLTALNQVRADDEYSFKAAAQRHRDGADWAAPDRPPVAAMGLRRRCDTADLWESALLGDRLWRHRAVHTGHVTGGEMVSANRAGFTVRCERMDCRLREGNSVCGWYGGIDSYERSVTFIGEIADTSACQSALLLTVTGVRVESRPGIGQWVSLMPAPPNAPMVRSGQYHYRRLQFGTDSWIAKGKPPGLIRRDVPLDVLISAAEAEGE